MVLLFLMLWNALVLYLGIEVIGCGTYNAVTWLLIWFCFIGCIMETCCLYLILWIKKRYSASLFTGLGSIEEENNGS